MIHIEKTNNDLSINYDSENIDELMGEVAFLLDHIALNLINMEDAEINSDKENSKHDINKQKDRIISMRNMLLVDLIRNDCVLDNKVIEDC